MEHKSTIRVASFNIGDFTTATESAGNDIKYGSGTQKTLAEYIAVFNRVNADLWGLQEDSEFFFYPEKILPYDALYKQILPNYERVFTRSYNGKAFLSDMELRDVKPIDYPPAVTSYAPDGTKAYGHPWFLTGKITLGGKEITIVTLHLDWNCKERRAVQLDTLVAFAAEQEYCILIGDFNPENLINGEACHDGDSVSPDTKNMYRVDWKRFDDARLIYANGGAFGTFGTIMTNGAPASPYPWDNIVVTPNIRILNAEAIYEPWMNDHAIVAADLEIL
ncbi:MAG: hypothetical protein IKZ09_03750 [Clostridia bacterium]|nr:hypothetical protein [Clostridia bacterium]